MADRLVIAVLGTRNSGKSETWNRLFDATVRTGKHPRWLYLNAAQSVEVFVVSGSPEERETKVEDILPDPLPQIVLCSVQYRDDAADTFRYFLRNGYELFVQWLNPGYSDGDRYADDLGLRDFLLTHTATLQERDGTLDPASRLKEIRQFLLGWATYRDLVQTEFPA
jgi:hypothetical protein